MFLLFFLSRFDYEGLDPRAAFYLMRDLEGVITDKAFTSQKFAVGDHVYSVEKAENFEYIDPVDGSVTRNQVSCSGNRKWRIAVHAEAAGMEMFRDAPISMPVSVIGTDTIIHEYSTCICKMRADINIEFAWSETCNRYEWAVESCWNIRTSVILYV